METDLLIHVDSKIDRIIENQGEDRERMVRVELLTAELRTEILSVKSAHQTCPGRIAEMQRQSSLAARRATLMMAGKLLSWTIGVVAAIAGAWQAIAAVLGG
jgi:hypothetical protein